MLNSWIREVLEGDDEETRNQNGISMAEDRHYKPLN